MLAIDAGSGVTLVIVTVCGSLVAPTSTSPKSSDATSVVTKLPNAAPLTATLPAGTVASDDTTLSDAACAPAVVVAYVTATVSDAPAASVDAADGLTEKLVGSA